MEKERRRHKRHTVTGRFLVSPGASELLYHVIDISRGGLSFRYLGKEELKDDLTELLLIRGEKRLLEGVPVRTVSDTPLPYDNIPLRRRGVRFAELSPDQQSCIDALLGQGIL